MILQNAPKPKVRLRVINSFQKAAVKTRGGSEVLDKSETILLQRYFRPMSIEAQTKKLPISVKNRETIIVS